MKTFAEVVVLNTATEPKKDDPKVIYYRVLVMQGVEAITFNVPSQEVYMKFESSVGQTVRAIFDYNSSYKNMKLLDCSLE